MAFDFFADQRVAMQVRKLVLISDKTTLLFLPRTLGDSQRGTSNRSTISRTLPAKARHRRHIATNTSRDHQIGIILGNGNGGFGPGGFGTCNHGTNAVERGAAQGRVGNCGGANVAGGV